MGECSEAASLEGAGPSAYFEEVYSGGAYPAEDDLLKYSVGGCPGEVSLEASGL